MKKLLAILAMMFFIGCATASKPCKCPTPAPPPAPSQEEVLAAKQAEKEVGIFKEWWEKEKVTFALFLTGEFGIPVTVKADEFGFLDDYSFAIMSVDITTPMATTRAYLVFTRPLGEWQVHSFINKSILDDLSEDEKTGEEIKVEKGNVYEL